MQKFWLGLALGVGAVALAQSVQSTLELRVNGANAGKAYVIGGVAHVPVGALKTLGVVVTQQGNVLTLGATGGTNQVAALEGCIGETLFNGVWRLTVMQLDDTSVNGTPGLGVTVEFKNALPKAIQPVDAGLNSNAFFLVDSNDQTIAADKISALSREIAKEVAYKSVPPGATLRYQFKFPGVSIAGPATAKKFLAITDTTKTLKDVKFTVKDPSFRVKLDCPR